MPGFLCITVRFAQPYCHGRGDGGEPEWPPSPLRLFQALVASAAGYWNERSRLTTATSALNWIEALTPPDILSPNTVPAEQPYRLYVPDNVADKVATSWAKGRDADIAGYRTEKDVRPTHLAGDAVHYLYPLPNGQCRDLDVLTAAARGITHLGWGIDMVVGDAKILSGEQAAALDGHRWRPTPVGGIPLRVPTEGTLQDLMRKHEAFLNRLSSDGFRPVPPLRCFRVQGYRRDGEPLQRPYRVFELRRTDGNRIRYPQRKFIHIAGMVRHLAKELMKDWPPQGVDDDWVRVFVAGHARDGKGVAQHRQLSYLPLPSIRGVHAVDPAVRRIMLTAPLGDEAWLDHVARHLAGQMLAPLRGDEFAGTDPPLLVPVRRDNIAAYFTRAANMWATVTPVILPGHDDHKPDKTRKLIERALLQSGIEQPCEFEWNAFSRFPKSLSAHKYDRDGRPAGYIRPDHLLSQTAVHLELRFADGVKVPGPLVIGAGRHCGFGLLAATDEP